MEELTIGARFQGFEGVAHGGYAAGALARHVGDAAQVYLRATPPIERPLRLERRDGWLLALDGETLVMQASAAEPQVEIPLRPSVGEAEAASARFPRAGWFPSCFVCSTTRPDTLGVHPGRLADTDAYAAIWHPREDEPATPELVWSAFDCATAWIVSGNGPALTGHIAARMLAPVPPGTDLIVVAWPLRERGRRREAGAALLTPDGDALGTGVYTWIGVDRLPEGLH